MQGKDFWLLKYTDNDTVITQDNIMMRNNLLLPSFLVLQSHGKAIIMERCASENNRRRNQPKHKQTKNSLPVIYNDVVATRTKEEQKYTPNGILDKKRKPIIFLRFILGFWIVFTKNRPNSSYSVTRKTRLQCQKNFISVPTIAKTVEIEL